MSYQLYDAPLDAGAIEGKAKASAVQASSLATS